MADDAHDLSEIEKLQQRLQVTTIFVARLAANLVAKTRLGLSQREVEKIIQGLKPTDKEGLSPEDKARSEVDGWQAALIEAEFTAKLGD